MCKPPSTAFPHLKTALHSISSVIEASQARTRSTCSPLSGIPCDYRLQKLHNGAAPTAKPYTTNVATKTSLSRPTSTDQQRLVNVDCATQNQRLRRTSSRTALQHHAAVNRFVAVRQEQIASAVRCYFAPSPTSIGSEQAHSDTLARKTAFYTNWWQSAFETSREDVYEYLINDMRTSSATNSPPTAQSLSRVDPRSDKDNLGETDVQSDIVGGRRRRHKPVFLAFDDEEEDEEDELDLGLTNVTGMDMFTLVSAWPQSQRFHTG